MFFVRFLVSSSFRIFHISPTLHSFDWQTKIFRVHRFYHNAVSNANERLVVRANGKNSLHENVVCSCFNATIALTIRSAHFAKQSVLFYCYKKMNETTTTHRNVTHNQPELVVATTPPTIETIPHKTNTQPRQAPIEHHTTNWTGTNTNTPPGNKSISLSLLQQLCHSQQ